MNAKTKISLEIDSDGIMLWGGQDVLPRDVFDKLEDAMACFPNGTTMLVEFAGDCFSEF